MGAVARCVALATPFCRCFCVALASPACVIAFAGYHSSADCYFTALAARPVVPPPRTMFKVTFQDIFHSFPHPVSAVVESSDVCGVDAARFVTYNVHVVTKTMENELTWWRVVKRCAVIATPPCCAVYHVRFAVSFVQVL